MKTLTRDDTVHDVEYVTLAEAQAQACPMNSPTRLPASAFSAFNRTLFIWAKQGQVRCLSPDEIRGREDAWRRDGWRYTATIDSAHWIEAMANGNTDPSDMLDELQMGPNAEVSHAAPPAASDKPTAQRGGVVLH